MVYIFFHFTDALKFLKEFIMLWATVCSDLAFFMVDMFHYIFFHLVVEERAHLGERDDDRKSGGREGVGAFVNEPVGGV